MTDSYPPAFHHNMTSDEIDTFLNWATAENDQLEADLDLLRAQLADPHADCIQPHLGPDNEHYDCDGQPI